MKCFVATIVAEINALQQPVQFAAIEAEHPGLTLGSDKAVPLQPLLPEAKPVAVPVEQLDQVPAAVAKPKQMTGERI